MQRIFLATVISVLLGTLPAGAIEFRGGDRIEVAPDEIVEDDLYATGETVLMAGTVSGDLVAAGRHVVVDGTVGGDLIAAGQVVEINGAVQDDARIAGMILRLGSEATVADDVLAAGYSLEGVGGSLVGGSLLFNGFQALLASRVKEGLTGNMSNLRLEGSVAGDVGVTVEGGPAPPFIQFIPTPIGIPVVESGLTLGESARIGGDLRYSAPAEGRIAPESVIGGEVSFNKKKIAPEEPPEKKPRFDFFVGVHRFFSLLIVGLLLVWWAPSWLDALSQTVRANSLASLGWGVVGVVAVPLAAVVILAVAGALAIALGMMSLGSLVMLVLALAVLAEAGLGVAFWVVAGLLAPVVVSLLAGRLLLTRAAPQRAAGRWLPLVVGLLLYVLLRWIPVLGWLVCLAVVLLGLGAVGLWGAAKLRRPVVTVA